jgi:hypothetical protein
MALHGIAGRTDPPSITRRFLGSATPVGGREKLVLDPGDRMALLSAKQAKKCP